LNPAADPQVGSGRARTAWACVGIFGVAIAAYWPVFRAGFIWDDDAHVTRAELQSLHGLWRIWFDLGSTQQYYPVLHGAFWLEHRLWGDAPLGYHLANVLLHATSACLFALALRRLAAPGAWFAGFLFALHPVCVESVAWISEQKNTLSLVFYLLAAHAYLHFDARRARGQRGGAGLYLLATGLFLLSLLSKTVTATLPAALLVVAWWRRGRLSWKGDVLPLAPWFVLAAGAGLFSAWVERVYVGAQGSEFGLTAAQRCLLAGRAIWFYLGKVVWPVGLNFIYPRWRIDAADGWQYLFPAAAAGLIAACWLLRRRSRGPLAALLFFVGSLFPTLGFLNVFAFIYSYVTDHWQYLASLGLIAWAAAGWGLWARRVGAGRLRGAATGPALAALAVSAALGVLTWRQCRIYHDAETFYRRTIERNPDDWMGHNNLAILLVRSDRAAEALDHYRLALRLAPDKAEIEFNLGDALVLVGHPGEAIAAFQEAIRLHADYPAAYANLGQTLLTLGRFAEAVPQFEAAIRLRPADADSEANLGLALAHTGRLAEAIGHYQSALRLQPNTPQVCNNLGSAFAAENRLPEAIAAFAAAVRLQPGLVEARYNLANALGNAGRLPEAITQYEEILRQQPDHAEAEANLGLALAQAGRNAEAVERLEAAVRRRPGYAEAHAYLGFALARAGRLPEAVNEYRRALALSPNSADVHYQLGVALRTLGAAAEAAEQLEAADRLAK